MITLSVQHDMVSLCEAASRGLSALTDILVCFVPTITTWTVSGLPAFSSVKAYMYVNVWP